jgi:hypothetical protein
MLVDGLLGSPVEDENTGLTAGYSGLRARKCNSRSVDVHHVQVPVLRRKFPGGAGILD